MKRYKCYHCGGETDVADRMVCWGAVYSCLRCAWDKCPEYLRHYYPSLVKRASHSKRLADMKPIRQPMAVAD